MLVVNKVEDDDEKIARFLFGQADENGDGALDKDEVRGLVNSVCKGLLTKQSSKEIEPELEKMFKDVDTVSSQGFCAWWMSVKHTELGQTLSRQLTPSKTRSDSEEWSDPARPAAISRLGLYRAHTIQGHRLFTGHTLSLW